ELANCTSSSDDLPFPRGLGSVPGCGSTPAPEPVGRWPGTRALSTARAYAEHGERSGLHLQLSVDVWSRLRCSLVHSTRTPFQYYRVGAPRGASRVVFRSQRKRIGVYG